MTWPQIHDVVLILALTINRLNKCLDKFMYDMTTDSQGINVISIKILIC